MKTFMIKDGELIVGANHMITPGRAKRIMETGVNKKGEPVEEVKIRTILTCRSKSGICAKCYGANMATGEAVQVGEAVGIIAAQSIGEPGTQLTMRTFTPAVSLVTISHRVFPVSRSFSKQESRRVLRLSQSSAELLLLRIPRRSGKLSLPIRKPARARLT